MPVCWFCGKSYTEGTGFAIPMYLVVKSEKPEAVAMGFITDIKGHTSYDVTKTRQKIWYRKQTVNIPRCASCSGKDAITTLSIMFLGTVIGAGLGFLLRLIPGMDTVVLCCGMSLGAFVGLAVSSKLTELTRHDARAKKKYPEIVRMLENGWRFGEKPEGSENIAPLP